MTRITNSPLVALVDYYRRLEADPNESVAEFGFSREKIHFQVVLEPDGRLASFDDIRLSNDRGKPIPNPMIVPDGGGRQGTGLKPFFCWDNTGYALGRDNKGNATRAESMFHAFRDLHVSMREELAGDEGFAALCRFLELWNPADFEKLPKAEEAAGMNVVFRVRGQHAYVHKNDAVRQSWLRRFNSAIEEQNRSFGLSLLTGNEERLARLHPQISGVADANTTGAALVSFEPQAFRSYGKDQSYNAPLGIEDAFRYTTALNELLASRRHRVRIGDATVLFWSDRVEATEVEELFAALLGEDAPKNMSAGSSSMADRLRVFLEAAQRGHLADRLADPEAPFYVFGLAPNISRLHVRFWLAGTVAQIVERLAEHASRLEIDGVPPNLPPPMIRTLLLETAREPKDIAPQLAGEVARAILSGTRYPQLLFNAVIRRTRADSAMNYRRAAILKAYLIRNHDKEISVALDKDHPDGAYHLGRLFAALEKTQEDASGGKLNSTIKDRYFSAASATPASVFPRILRLHQHHLDKVENPGLRVSREKLVGEICGRLQFFPPHMPLEQQGLFYIGYYHQRQDFFTKKEEPVKETVDA